MALARHDAKVDGYGGSHVVPSPPSVGGRGWLVQTELGPKATKLSLGWGRMVGVGATREREEYAAMAPPLTLGWALKASVVRAQTTNGVLTAGDVYIGGEVDLALGVRLTVGAFQGVGANRDRLISWGIGVGF